MILYINSYFSRVEGGCRGGDAGEYRLPRRTAVKVDTTAALAMEAASRLAPSIVADRERVGVCIANRLGGWRFAWAEMARVHATRSTRDVNVYLGTAWFPAASQGEISIAHGLRGHAKTFAGDGRAFVEAIDWATRLIHRGVADQVVVGAVEAADCPWVAERVHPRPRTAAGFLLLGREPMPSPTGRRVTVVAGASDPEPMDQDLDPYPAETATRLVEWLDQALALPSPTTRSLFDPSERRRVTFTIA